MTKQQSIRNALLLFEERGRIAFLFSETGTRQECSSDIKGKRSFLAPRSFFGTNFDIEN